MTLLDLCVFIIVVLIVFIWGAFFLWKYRQFIIEEEKENIKENLKMQLEVKYSIERHTILKQVREWRKSYKSEKNIE